MIARRGAALTIAATLWGLAAVAPAMADPAGPTDYTTTVIATDPPTEHVSVEVIGGDSFVLLSVEGDVLVEVTGYRGEPYLRFLPGGVVEQNERSPSAYLNEDRYAAVNLPVAASASAPPEWRQVASNGSYAWHDHRAHWMNDAPPPGRGPGDQILEGVIPLIVDGVEVDVTVASVWQPAPSVLPVLAGVVLGLGVAAAAAVRSRWRATEAGVGFLAACALIAGLVAFLAVPRETAPPWTLWALPAASLVIAGVVATAQLGGRRGGLTARSVAVLTLVATFQLIAWGVMRWDWMWRAVLPTSMPFWVDRATTAAALAGGAGLAALALHRIIAGVHVSR